MNYACAPTGSALWGGGAIPGWRPAGEPKVRPCRPDPALQAATAPRSGGYISNGPNQINGFKQTMNLKRAVETPSSAKCPAIIGESCFKLITYWVIDIKRY